MLFFIQLVTDLDVLLPILEAAARSSDLPATPRALTTDELCSRHPDVEAALGAAGIERHRLPAARIFQGVEPSLADVRALITATETTAGPHAAAHALAWRANQSGIVTYTLQHGFENIGLTYFDRVHDRRSIRFASRRILIWGPLSSLHRRAPEETRSRCLPIGCPKETIRRLRGAERPGGRPFLVAVFENLHWHRYRERARRRFLADLLGTARRFPDTTFVVKTHPAGRWLLDRYQGERLQAENLIVIGSGAPGWEAADAARLLGMADGAITTPSTVALDAARAGCPVAVARCGVSARRYRPLTVIRRARGWAAFVESLRSTAGRAAEEERGRRFVSRVLLPGDAVGRILELLRSDLEPGRRQGG